MLKEELKKIRFMGKEYPYKCDMVVLEKIQKEYGDAMKYEYGVRGVIPYIDENGKRVRKKDSFTVPDVGMTCRSLAWMIEEGMEISEEDGEAPTEKMIMRQEDLTIAELAVIAYEEYTSCFLTKARREEIRKMENSKNSKKNETSQK